MRLFKIFIMCLCLVGLASCKITINRPSDEEVDVEDGGT